MTVSELINDIAWTVAPAAAMWAMVHDPVISGNLGQRRNHSALVPPESAIKPAFH
jgi:hypothetical protein